MNMSRYRQEYFTRYAIISLALLPLIAHVTFQMKLSATLTSVNPSGEARRLVLSGNPVMSEDAVKSFFVKGMIRETSVRWEEIEGKYTRPESYYFSDEAWKELCETEFRNNTPAFFYENNLNRSRVLLVDPVVVSVRRGETDTYYLVQALFLRTLRGRTGQESKRFVTTGTVRVSSVTEQHSAAKIVHYKDGPA